MTNLQNAIAAVEEDLANQGGDDNQGGNGGQGGNTENPDNQGGQDNSNTQDSQNGQNNQNVQNGPGNSAGNPADNSGNQTSEPRKAVQTGDNTPVLLWAAVLAASAAGIIILEMKRRKQL